MQLSKFIYTEVKKQLPLFKDLNHIHSNITFFENN